MPPPRHRTPAGTDASARPNGSLAERAARSVPGRAQAILARAGAGRRPEPGDELPTDVAEALAARRAATEGK